MVTKKKSQKILRLVVAIGAMCGLAIANNGLKGAAIAQPLSSAATAKQANSSNAQALSSLIEETRVVYTFEYTHAGSPSVGRDFLVLKDGTFTRDFSGVLDDGIAASRQANPRQWGTWQLNAEGDFVYRYQETSDWTKPIASTPSSAAASNETLDGCYTSPTTVSVSGNFSLLFYALCFGPNGVFSHSRTRSTPTSEAIAGFARDTAGYYQINGPVITLQYGNGFITNRIVGIYPGQISIDGTIFSASE